MKLLAFQAHGFRSLVAPAEIPLGRPTVLTGMNDGGKSSSLDALGFLLGENSVSEEDLSHLSPTRTGDEAQAAPGEDVEPTRVDELQVTGRFSITDEERDLFGMSSEVRLRRTWRPDSRAWYEVLLEVPKDPRLRGLQDALLGELRDRAGALSVEADGDARHKTSWIGPLETLAASTPTVTEWVSAPRDVLAELPSLVRFSSTAEPDLQSEIHAALRESFQMQLDDPDIMGPIRDAERRITEGVIEAADRLREHLQRRCPDLTSISLEPQVSFREGFQRVDVGAGTGGSADVPIQLSGAGRRRRMTLAVWEWTQELIAQGDGQRQTIIAYDEPDTHLDYNNQRELVDLLREQAAQPGVAVIVATHSLNLIDKVDISDVVHLELVEHQTHVRRLLTDGHEDIEQHLARISTAMGLRNSVLLHERCFLGVEGATERQAVPLLFRLATGLSLQAAGVALISGEGNTGVLKLAEWLNHRGRRIHFLVDRDSEDEPVFSARRLGRSGIRPEQIHLVGDPRELEDLFDDATWADTANAVWQRDDGRPWAPDDITALRGATKFSKALEDAVRLASSQAPSGKPGYLVELASRLERPEQVPDQLRACFDAVRDLADTSEAVQRRC